MADPEVIETRRVVIQYEIATPLSPPPQPQMNMSALEQAVLAILAKNSQSRAPL